MPAKQTKINTTPITKSSSDVTLKQKFQQRESEEIILGFSGPIGCGVDSVNDQAKETFEEIGYKVHHIKLSDYIKKLAIKEKLIDQDIGELTKANRYRKLQLAGNGLRKKFQPDILTEFATTKIALHRTSGAPEETPIEDIIPNSSFGVQKTKNTTGYSNSSRMVNSSN